MSTRLSGGFLHVLGCQVDHLDGLQSVAATLVPGAEGPARAGHLPPRTRRGRWGHPLGTTGSELIWFCKIWT